jgi:hypothetical protein
MVYLQLFIISKSGGLIYNQDLSEAAPLLNANDWLRLGGNFYGMHAIASQIAPVVSGGIEKLETGSFKLQCFQVVEMGRHDLVCYCSDFIRRARISMHACSSQ